MKCEIKVSMDNAAFEDDPRQELADILKKVVEKLETSVSMYHYVLRDTNGNKVGEFTIR